MNEEGPVIQRGSYTWHPVYPYLMTLLSDMQGAMEYKPSPAQLGGATNFRKYEKKLEEIAPTIIKMRAEGRTRKEIKEVLGIGNATLTKYIHDINEWGLGKC